MVTRTERVFTPDSRVFVYWVAHCEGFEVRTGRRTLGAVERVVGDEPFGGAEALLVRSRLRRRTVLLEESTVAPLLVAVGRLAVAALRVSAVVLAAETTAGAKVLVELRRRLPPLLHCGARNLRVLATESADGVQELALLVREAIADATSGERRL